MRTRRTILAGLLGVVLGTGLGVGAVQAAGEAVPPPAQDWSFNGLFGTFDLASAQRGLQVYEQVCATCHGLYHLDYRHLADLGFSEEEVAAIAAQYTVMDGPDEDGEMFERPARASDSFVVPFANEQAARASNGGAYPVDLSLIVAARGGGADYLYAFLTGYEDAPDGEELPPGQHWNRYYPGHQIAMPNILLEGGTAYTDGTEATVAQQAWDVTNFLAWSSDPHMVERKEMGVRVILFLIVFTALMYAVKRKIWSDVDH